MLSTEPPKSRCPLQEYPSSYLPCPTTVGLSSPPRTAFRSCLVHLVPVQAPIFADHRTSLHEPMSPFLLRLRGRQNPERWSQLNWNTSPQGAALAACTDHACVVARCIEVRQHQPLCILLTGLPFDFVCIIRSFGTTQWSPREL